MKKMGVKITKDIDKRKITAEISGDLDHHTSKYIRSDIDLVINDSNPTTLILDFSGVTFMDSSGIGLIMGRYKLMKEKGGEVIIANAPVYIKKVIMLSGMDKLCKIITTDTLKGEKQ